MRRGLGVASCATRPKRPSQAGKSPFLRAAGGIGRSPRRKDASRRKAANRGGVMTQTRGTFPDLYNNVLPKRKRAVQHAAASVGPPLLPAPARPPKFPSKGKGFPSTGAPKGGVTGRGSPPPWGRGLPPHAAAPQPAPGRPKSPMEGGRTPPRNLPPPGSDIRRRMARRT